MTIWGLILRALLLLALLATMSVPNGFMRASGPDGMGRVLCTAEGPQEILLDPSGNQVPDTGSEDAAAAYMKNTELEITVDLGLGTGDATVWTCDLTHGYISINADYRS